MFKNYQDKRRQGHYFPGNEKGNGVLQEQILIKLD